MKKFLAVLALAPFCAVNSRAQENAPLRLVQTIPVPGVERKWDHFGVDLKSNRLFVTSEEEPALEVFGLQTNKHISTLTDFKEPQNVLPLPELKEILVVAVRDSALKILDYSVLKLTADIPLQIYADP